MAEAKDEEAKPDEPSSGGNPAGNQQGDAPGDRPVDRELQVTEDPTGGHGQVGVGDDGPVPEGSNGGVQGELFPAGLIQARFERSGPLPTVADFAGYENVLPGAADRILKMAETAQAAAVEDSHTSTRAEAKAFLFASFGVTYFSWLLGVCTILLFIAGQTTAAAAAGIATAGLAGPQIISAVRPKKPEGTTEKKK